MAVAKHCVNGSRDIRRKAVGYLQRLLLSQQLMSSEQAALSAVFARVLLPILEELLKPQVFDRDPAGMEETRLRAATLLCKVFLQYLMLLGESKETVANLLTRVIDLLERFMRTGSRQLVSDLWHKGARREELTRYLLFKLVRGCPRVFEECSSGHAVVWPPGSPHHSGHEDRKAKASMVDGLQSHRAFPTGLPE